MDIQTFAVTALLSLFVIIDPVGLSAIFLSITDHLTAAQRRRTAIKAVLIGGGILLVFLFAGGPLLEYLGVSIDAMRIAGGLLLFKVAFDMVFARRERTTDAEEEEAHEKDDVAVFPLAIPLIAGPGAFATVLVLGASADQQADLIAVLVGAIVLILVLVYLGLLFAIPLQRLLGETGTAVVARVLGIILAALAVQLVADGVLSIVNGS